MRTWMATGHRTGPARDHGVGGAGWSKPCAPVLAVGLCANTREQDAVQTGDGWNHPLFPTLRFRVLPHASFEGLAYSCTTNSVGVVP